MSLGIFCCCLNPIVNFVLSKNTAKLFRKLGMAKYSAMEAFKKYNFLKS